MCTYNSFTMQRIFRENITIIVVVNRRTTTVLSPFGLKIDPKRLTTFKQNYSDTNAKCLHVTSKVVDYVLLSNESK